MSISDDKIAFRFKRKLVARLDRTEIWTYSTPQIWWRTLQGQRGFVICTRQRNGSLKFKARYETAFN
jgi:hypothetical protein